MESIKDKEKNIVGTILHCTNEIKKFNNINNNNLFESENLDLYKYNMLNLYSNVTEQQLFDFDSNISTIPNCIENHRGNFYAYFNKVISFLNGYEPSLQKSLNENLFVDLNKIEQPTQININTFKDKLKDVIYYLETQDNFKLDDNKILSIKSFAKKPILVNGFNIIDNIQLLNELKDKFNTNNIISICYNKVNKQILFITDNSGNLFVYDLKLDILDYWNNINSNKIQPKKLDKINYLKEIKLLTDINAIYELSVNINNLDFKFADNLYNDIKYNEFRNTLNKQNKIFK